MFDFSLSSSLPKITGLWLFNDFYGINRKFLIYSIIVRFFEFVCIIFSIYLIFLSIKDNANIIYALIFQIPILINSVLNVTHICSQYYYKELWKQSLVFKTEKTKYSNYIFLTNCAEFGIIFILALLFRLTQRLDHTWRDNAVYIGLLIVQITFSFKSIIVNHFSILMENLIIKQQKINKEMELLNNELYLKLFVNILIKKHDEIIINARLINTIFSWQNLCLCTICTIGFISNVYGVCVKLFLKLQIRALLLNITYFVHYFGIIQAVAYYCENLRGQVK